MKNKLRFYPFNMGSNGLSELQVSINMAQRGTALRVAGDSDSYSPRDNHLVVNWGSASIPSTWTFPEDGLNKPNVVNVAGNKLLTFQRLQEAGITIPEFTTHGTQASNWVMEGHTVLLRHVLRGHSGEGIEIYRPEYYGGSLSSNPVWVRFDHTAPLYVKYKKKKNEYRVHVFNGQVLFVQEKRRERERERTADESLVRSHQNGWVFCREGIEYQEPTQQSDLHNIAINAVNALGLDFGAVDIIYNARENQHYVLEINTAPGLEGESVTDYTNAFLGLLDL
jgi:glutathione synthase/RimK-type ligase-like ATP-grasp enzyme